MSAKKTLLQYRNSLRNIPMTRITLIMGCGILVAFIILLRLAQLQLIQGAYYKQVAFEKNQGYTEIPARRGEILIQDRHSGEPFALATNTTLNMVFADPTLIDDPLYIGKKLAPLLFDLEEEQERDEERYNNLIDEIEDALKLQEKEAAAEAEAENEEENTDENTGELETTAAVAKEPEEAPPIITAEILAQFAQINPSYDDLRLHTDDELFTLYEQQLIDTLSQKTRPVVLLIKELDGATAAQIKALRINGVEVTENGNLYAYPPQIADKERVAKFLSEPLDWDRDHLTRILEGRNRYVILKRKLDPSISDQIEQFIAEEPKVFMGVRMREEYFRFYPEQELGAQILGYVSNANKGQYGLEGTFEKDLKGESGFFTSQIDATGNQITVGDSEIQDAQNGANIMLTIDRAIQAEAEKIIAGGVEEFQADSGLMLIQESKTGRILAMAHAPTFNPNKYSDVYELEEIELTDEDRENLYIVGEGENQRMYLYITVDPDYRIELFYDPETDEYYKYKNNVGPEVYQLKAVTLPYEPGSVFKPVAMAAAIDAGEVTPYSTFTSTGPIQVDEFEIHTFNDVYYGISTMTEVLIHSDNTGMAYIAEKLGRALFYDYLSAFGFGEKSHIEFEGEHTGRVEYYDYWADSELVTKAFGQGITVTPVQLVTAISAIANGGLLMQPYMIDFTEEPDGRRQHFEPHIIRRVLKPETAHQVAAMMTAVVEEGAPLARLDEHFAAGKTGTAQTYKWGKALKGRGTTITSFVGFAPVEDPQFTVLIKLDRPKTIEWGAATAGPLFKEIGEFMVDYYNIPPDRTEPIF